jgi:non-ribosomal peptide synthetase component F
VQPGPSFHQIIRDLKLLQKKQGARGNDYWNKQREQFSRAKSCLNFPRVRTEPEDLQCSQEVVVDVGTLYERLRAAAREMNVTIATMFHAAWALVLSIFSDSDSVVFGCVLSGRTLPLVGVEEVVGPLVNTLPMGIEIKRTESAIMFIQKVFSKMVELAEFQWTTPENGFSRQFESALAMQFDFQFGDYAVAPIEKPHFSQSTDIPLSIAIEADGTFRIQYHVDRFSQENIERLSACYLNALRALLKPQVLVGACLASLLIVPIQETLRMYGNCVSGLTTMAAYVQEDLITLFEEAVQQSPDSIAVEKGEVQILYGELDRAASVVASRVSEHISPGDIVCMHSDRSINWIVGIYGILKAGGVYCSMDVALPYQLRSSMYVSASAKAFLVPQTSQLVFKPETCTACLSIEAILQTADDKTPSNQIICHRQVARPTDSAYLCFTSGSTGQPKGVLCTHQGLVAFQTDLEVRLHAQKDVRIAQAMSAAFDGSIHEIFSALSYGATLVLPDGPEMFSHLKTADSTILTPSIAAVLDPEDFPQLSSVRSDIMSSIMPNYSNAKCRYTWSVNRCPQSL